MTSFTRLSIPEVIEVCPPRFGDDRGYFSEVYKRSAFEAEGLHMDWVQDNQSFSAQVGTVRGLHLQKPPVPQDKLVRVIRGAIFDVAVDLRRGSPSFGCWVSCELTAEKGNQLLVPTGFAHGFMTLTENTEVLYKVSGPYSGAHEVAIAWNDADIGIDWPEIGSDIILSEKDKAAGRFIDFETPFQYER